MGLPVIEINFKQKAGSIIERSARADGYAKPNERIWVDLSGK